MTKSITAPGVGGGGGGEVGIALLHAYKGRATRQGLSIFGPTVWFCLKLSPN